MFNNQKERLNSIKMNIEQIKKKISKLDLESLSKSSGFQKRKPKKLEIIGLLGGFWMMILSGQHSLSAWSRQIFRFSNFFLSKQGLHKRLSAIHTFGEDLLKQVLSEPLERQMKQSKDSKLFSYFSNVYVEDSTCISLPSMLHEVFPGPHNRYGKSATARIQLRLNILKNWSSQIVLQSFRDSDAKYAQQIVSQLKAGDLVIRDLGYYVLRVFKKIAQQKAFFLTRIKYRTCIYQPNDQQIDLVSYLKKAYRNKETVIDLTVLLGKKDKVKGRLIAIKAPQNVVLARKRKATKNRDRRLNHNQDYFYLLEWTILLTNVPKEQWNVQQALQAYRLRWRIEIIFKCWKSKFKFEYLFKQHQSLNPNRAKLTIYLLLAMITMFYTKWYAFFVDKVFETKGLFVSPFKFADFVKEHFWDLLLTIDLVSFIPQVAFFCSYEKRKRPNYLELFLAL